MEEILTLIAGRLPHMSTVVSAYISDYFRETTKSEYGANGDALRDFLEPLLSDAPYDPAKVRALLDQIVSLAVPEAHTAATAGPSSILPSATTKGPLPTIVNEDEDDEEEDDEDEDNIFLNQVGDIAHALSSRGGGHSLVNRRRLAKQEERQRKKQEERELQHAAADNAQAEAEANTLAKTYYVPPDLSPAEIMALMDAQLGRGRPTDVKIDNFDLTHTGLRILTNANLMLAYGRRYGLVGRNGIGKSTLMRALARRDLPIPKTMSVLLVDQEVDGDDTTVLSAVLQADMYRETLLKEEKALTAEMEASQREEGAKEKSGTSDAANKLKEVYNRLQAIEADKAEPRAAAILSGLGFDLEAQGRATKTFSGGWRMRVSLAKALFCKPDILLLDEPTNMLDVPAVIWLERYLQNWPSTLLIVSHDRTFLNEVVTDILHHQHEQLVHYKGDFNNFVGTRAERQKNALREYESQKQYREHLQDFIDRWRYNANRAALAQSKIKILEKLPPLIKPTDDAPIVFRWPEPEPLSPPVLQMDQVTFGYTPDKIILKHVNFDMLMTSRLAIIGPNGAGKSTMIKILTGVLSPLSGIVHRNAKLRIAVFSQHHIDQLDLRSNSVQFLARMFPGMPDEEYRRQLGAFGITGTTSLQKIATLSGGQRSRVAFAMMSLMRPHFLIFDEPTNFLDLDSIDALIESLTTFQGGVVVISHDERFISTVCQDIWIVDHQQAQKFYGTMAEYKKSFVKELEEKIEAMERSTANI